MDIVSPPDHLPPPIGESQSGDLVKGVIDILKRRYLILISVFAAVLGLFIVALLLMTPRYSATARVKIDPKPLTIAGMSNDQPSMPDQSIVDTEVSVIRSHDVARAVVEKLHLDRTEEFGLAKDDAAAKLSPDEQLEAVINKVSRKLDVTREKSTYLVDISFKSVDATRAAAVANAFADAYLAAAVQRRTGSAEQQYAYLDKRLAQLRDQARAADEALAQYKAARGITEGGQLGTVTDQQIAPLSTQLATAQAAAAAAASDLAVARAQMSQGGAAAASSVLNTPAISALRSNRAQVQQTLSQLSTRYGPKHPQTVQAQQQLEAIDRQINEEAKRILGELQARKSAAAAQAGSLAGDLSRLRGEQASNARSSVTADTLQRDADAKHNAYNRLADLAQQLDQGARSSQSQAQIIERATVPLKPSSPKALLLIAAGIVVGATAALASVAALELMNSGVRSTSEVEQQFGLRVLSTVPLIGAREMKNSDAPSTLVVRAPMSPYAEAFRVLRSSLILSGGRSPQVVALVSTLPNEGKTTSALSLARVMAMAGDRTLVIDGDLRRAGLGALMPQRPATGLVEVLRDGRPVDEAIIADEVPNLDVLTAAEASFLPDDLFGGEAMAALLKTLRTRYDRIVFDTPPVLGVADARTIASMSDAVVLALKWNATSRGAVSQALKWLRLDNAPVLGAVMTMVSPKAEAFGALYYSRAYARYYQTA
ncbi:GumC family protein [Sphingomonas morindae]|uniref:non-specific protein-tyrosine kinase n=1 Tax=Sphingomonas morindae TaxID=1541170 RepID=A0ABY4X6G8_9SPHN|nr:polysaccharide biosynthesis tyrosine autokinase [Sphingomonas morindae]USI72474.1 polysaccharide biosynthesis tyrosine autokinase [Sphingomonas morindae]